MIHIDHLTFGYSRRKLLYSDLSLRLEPGKIYGLLGKNGAGKSTLLKNLAGLLKPLSGRISVFNENPARRDPAFLERIYIIPEEVYSPPLSIARYLKLFAPFYPRFSAEDFNRFMQIFEVDTSGHLKKLSLGQKKKVIIAFALACNTDLLILDEPTNGLDIPSKAQFRRLIASAMNDKRLVLISTHQTRDLDQLIDSVLIVDNGKLLLSAPIAEVGARLAFEIKRELPVDERLFFAESTIGGYATVSRNDTGVETDVNLEFLFHAVTNKPREIARLFHPQTHAV